MRTTPLTHLSMFNNSYFYYWYRLAGGLQRRGPPSEHLQEGEHHAPPQAAGVAVYVCVLLLPGQRHPPRNGGRCVRRPRPRQPALRAPVHRALRGACEQPTLSLYGACSQSIHSGVLSAPLPLLAQEDP
eukprot:5028316-Pyramimonas_sp.AAC.2